MTSSAARVAAARAIRRSIPVLVLGAFLLAASCGEGLASGRGAPADAGSPAADAGGDASADGGGGAEPAKDGGGADAGPGHIDGGPAELDAGRAPDDGGGQGPADGGDGGPLDGGQGPVDAGSFSLASDATFFIVDTGAGLLFKVRRHNADGTTKGLGDIGSMVYRGVEYQDSAKGSQVNSGFDYLYAGKSDVAVDASKVDADDIKITVTAASLTHYYLAHRGEAKIFMATYFTSEPDELGMVRFIVRVPVGKLPHGPSPSDIRGNTGAIEASDVYGVANGETRSKHYSNMRLKDWSSIGATGAGVGMWVVRDNNEGNSGGPFYRCLLDQATDTDQELTYIVNYGEAQTEPFRPGILSSYTLVFTDGGPAGAVDTSWFARMALTGYVPAAGRGAVAGDAIDGRDPAYAYTVGFSNSTAQYWTEAAAADGRFQSPAMIPGTYAMQVYKNELMVDARTVVVQAGQTTAVGSLSIAFDPSAAAAVWRVGDWDGTPTEFLNGDKVTTMHPSDVRMKPWSTADYVVGTSAPGTGFPAYQWKDVNGSVAIRFSLRQDQLRAMTLRVGITTAFENGRPTVKVNGWSSSVPSPSTQPSSRTLTVGTYRGNNTTFSFAVPATAFVAGENVVTLGVASGTSGTAYLSPGVAYDAVDLIAP